MARIKSVTLSEVTLGGHETTRTGRTNRAFKEIINMFMSSDFDAELIFIDEKNKSVTLGRKKHELFI